MKTHTKTLFLIISLIILPALMLPFSANAIIIVDLVTNVAKVLTNVVLILTVIAWLVTALLFLMATGNPNLISLGKKALFAAVAGTVLYIISGVAINIISNALLQGQ